MIGNRELYLNRTNLKDNIIMNKTYIFLSHVMKEYGNVFFSNMINGLIACGIGDSVYYNVKNSIPKYNLFLLHKIKEGKTFLKRAKSLPCYVDDYPLDLNKECQYHMSVIQIPSKYHKAYDKFIESKYSEMYEQNDLNELKISNDKRFIQVYYMLTKNDTYFEEFKKAVNDYFKTNVDFAKESVSEYSLPLDMNQEIFFKTKQ